MRPYSRYKTQKICETNIGALDVTLTNEELKKIEDLFPAGSFAGERYRRSWNEISQYLKVIKRMNGHKELLFFVAFMIFVLMCI